MVIFTRKAIVLSVVGLLAGCSGGAEGDDGFVDSDEGALEDDGGWTSLGTGVSYQSVGDGPNVLIAYGGYSATDTASRGWAKALVAARLESAHQVGKIYAVKGPADSGYGGREIKNSAIARRLVDQHGDATKIIIVAHSSGGFVANELFSQLASRSPSVLPKIDYFDLDGATPSSHPFRSVVFVSARDGRTGTRSANDSVMVSAARSRGAVHKIIDASEAGCNAGAKWCVHDAMINSRCHNPNRFDLTRDYTNFSGGRHVIVEYFDEIQ